MTSLGTADKVQSPVDWGKYIVADATLHIMRERLYIGPADRVQGFDPKYGVVIPTVGQLWPRKVWQYNDYTTAPAGTLGYADRIYNYFEYGIFRHRIYSGQLWPRGDYIANGQFEVKIP